MADNNIKSWDFPFRKFEKLLIRAKKVYDINGIGDYNAFCLATCENNIPSTRMVLLKSFSNDGFIFYTNLNSKKSQDILENPNVAMLFHWKELKIQVRIVGKAIAVSKEEADEYFNSRAYLSKIGAWASDQSQEMIGFMDLHKRVASYGLKFKHEVPRPEHWSGFSINPDSFEFWQEKPFRLHLRKKYIKFSENCWKETLLYP